LREEALELMRDPDAVLVNVVVGAGTNMGTWNLYEALLCKYSEFFRAALQGQFKEAKEKQVTLPDDNPEVLELFVQWIFTGGYVENGYLRFNRVNTREHFENLLVDPNLEDSVFYWCDLHDVHTWALGDKLRSDKTFRNYTMNNLYHKLVPYPGTSAYPK